MRYALFDSYFGKEWLLEVDITTKNIIWNQTHNIHENLKKMYLKLYKKRIIETAEKI